MGRYSTTLAVTSSGSIVTEFSRPSEVRCRNTFVVSMACTLACTSAGLSLVTVTLPRSGKEIVPSSCTGTRCFSSGSLATDISIVSPACRRYSACAGVIENRRAAPSRSDFPICGLSSVPGANRVGPPEVDRTLSMAHSPLLLWISIYQGHRPPPAANADHMRLLAQRNSEHGKYSRQQVQVTP